MDILTLASDTQVLALDWSSGLLGTISGVMKLAAVLIVIAAVVKAWASISGGKIGAGVKVLLGAAILVTFMWEPSLIEKLISAFSNLTSTGVEEVGNLTNPGGGVSGGGSTK